MPSIDSYTAKSTSVNYQWPSDVTGIERIMLSAQGDLQRLLSSFFARPITVALVYANTKPSEDATSEKSTIQTRQVHLMCSNKIVCTATSTVRITSPNCARLFLQEKYAIGQVFAEIGRTPRFQLVDVGVGSMKSTKQTEKTQLWRKYKLDVEGFECEILEVFPDREMFLHGERWLQEGSRGYDRVDRCQPILQLWEKFRPRASRRYQITLVVILVETLVCGLIITFEIFSLSGKC